MPDIELVLHLLAQSLRLGTMPPVAWLSLSRYCSSTALPPIHQLRSHTGQMSKLTDSFPLSSSTSSSFKLTVSALLAHPAKAVLKTNSSSSCCCSWPFSGS